VLINSVLNSIPIYYLSFMKMPVVVWKKIVRLQREFLWGGVGGGKKINWVKWMSVCKRKEDGGLGVRDIRIVNVSLLEKWRWRLLASGNALWKEVLMAKYGVSISRMVERDSYVCPRFSSSWWKDIVNLEGFGENSWFNSEVVRRVGNGLSTSFWNDIWIGNLPLRVSYPRLFSISTQKEESVGSVGEALNHGIEWSFGWRRTLFVWEEHLLADLQEDLRDFRFVDEEDGWRWRLEEDGCFSVKSMYEKLQGLMLVDEMVAEDEKLVFSQIWKSPAPLKVVAFSCRLLLDRIPTRVNLQVRNVLPLEAPLACVLCESGEETSNHLFLHCSVASTVWMKISNWLDFNFLIPPNLFTHCLCWNGWERNKKVRRGLWLI
jgi:hypothetical protein